MKITRPSPSVGLEMIYFISNLTDYKVVTGSSFGFSEFVWTLYRGDSQ